MVLMLTPDGGLTFALELLFVVFCVFFGLRFIRHDIDSHTNVGRRGSDFPFVADCNIRIATLQYQV